MNLGQCEAEWLPQWVERIAMTIATFADVECAFAIEPTVGGPSAAMASRRRVN
jgi:hypothetical protein